MLTGSDKIASAEPLPAKTACVTDVSCFGCTISAVLLPDAIQKEVLVTGSDHFQPSLRRLVLLGLNRLACKPEWDTRVESVHKTCGMQPIANGYFSNSTE